MNNDMSNGMNNLMNTRNDFQVLNERGAYNAIRWLNHNIRESNTHTFFRGGTSDLSLAGGILIFSSEVACSGACDAVVSRINQVVRSVAKDSAVSLGHYVNDGFVFHRWGMNISSQSLSAAIRGVSFDELLLIAKELCKAFSQPYVLLRVFESSQLILIKT